MVDKNKTQTISEEWTPFQVIDHFCLNDSHHTELNIYLIHLLTIFAWLTNVSFNVPYKLR